MTYKIDAERRTVRTTCVGDVTLREVLDHFRALEQDPECPELVDVVLDLRETSSLPETHQVGIVVSELGRIRGRVRFGVCAILADRDALFGMMRMFEAMAEPYFRTTRTFRVASEAEAWLGSQQSPADQDSDLKP